MTTHSDSLREAIRKLSQMTDVAREVEKNLRPLEELGDKITTEFRRVTSELQKGNDNNDKR